MVRHNTHHKFISQLVAVLLRNHQRFTQPYEYYKCQIDSKYEQQLVHERILRRLAKLTHYYENDSSEYEKQAVGSALLVLKLELLIKYTDSLRNALLFKFRLVDEHYGQ